GRAAAPATPPAPASAPAASPGRFTDVADSLGVRFKHTNGESGRLYIAETMGAGCAFLDYDGDGRLDLFLVNSSRLPGFTGKGPFFPALYHQRPDGTFEDATKPAGLAIDCYGMGCAVGDYDNDGRTFTDVTKKAGVALTTGKALGIVVWDMNGDGWPDFAVANDTVPNWLFRNNRNGTFTEVSVEDGIAYGSTGQARAGMGVDT